MRKLTTGAIFLALLLNGCSSGSAELATTTTQPATTAISKKNVEVFIWVYDTWKTATTYSGRARPADLQMHEPCTLTQMQFVKKDAQVVLRDANSGVTVAIGNLEAGTLNHGIIPELFPPSEEALFWACEFHATLHDVPLDRDFYSLSITGDYNPGWAMTYSLADVKEDGGLLMTLSHFIYRSPTYHDRYR